MVTHSPGYARPQQLAPQAVVIDSLPEDPVEVLLSTANDYEPCADFLAYVKTSRIDNAGELVLTLGVPFEFKYDALQLTDMRGVQFHVIVRQPKRGGAKGVVADSAEEANSPGPFTFSRGVEP